MAKIEVTFWATIAQVRTLADGGIRVTMDLPEDDIMQAAQLMECKRAGLVLAVDVKVKEDSERERCRKTRY